MCQTCSDFNPFQPDFLHADGADTPGDTSTTDLLRIGQTLGGTLGEDDEDWFRIELQPGETYTLTTSDGATGTVKDTLLVLYDRHGNEVELNDDDGPGFHAQLSFEATNKVYFAAVTTYQAHFGYPSTDAGSYRISLTQKGAPGSGTTDPGAGTPDLPVYTNNQIAKQLVTEYWEDSGRSARGFDVDVSGGTPAVIYVDTSGLTEEGQWFANSALEAWSAISGLTFFHDSPPAGTPVGIRFEDDNSGAYASTTLHDSGAIANVMVNVSKNWIIGDEYDYDSYALQTFMHEIGHALGLGHAGGYNIGEGLSINYAAHAEFANDSWQSTIMSYFSQEENTATDGSKAYLLTPTAADILAIREIYGTDGDLRKGTTVYGEGSTAGDFYDHLTKLWDQMSFTLLDDGGRDRLNVSSAEMDQRIDLRPEHFSDLGGQIGNMSIARGTWIEAVYSGAGDDDITGNRGRNTVKAGDGDDSVTGLVGNDTLKGEAGDDTLSGDQGGDRLLGGKGQDRLLGGNGKDRLFGGADADRLLGEGGRDFLTGGGGKDVFVFAPGTGFDRITDFQPGQDRLDLRGFDLEGFQDVADHMYRQNAFLVIDLGTAKIELKDITLDDLDAGDLIL